MDGEEPDAAAPGSSLSPRLSRQIRRVASTLRLDVGLELGSELAGVLGAIQTSIKIIARAINRAGIDRMLGTPGPRAALQLSRRPRPQRANRRTGPARAAAGRSLAGARAIEL
jgi:hypothetical protein